MWHSGVQVRRAEPQAAPGPGRLTVTQRRWGLDLLLCCLTLLRLFLPLWRWGLGTLTGCW